MRTELSVEIDRPIDQVFTLTNDHVTEWSVTCIEEEMLEEKPGEVGSTFRIVTADRGREMVFTGTVTEYEPPRRSRVDLVGDTFDLDVLYTFDDLDGRTRVTQTSEVRGKGLFKVLLPLMGWMMKKASCKAQDFELANLKTYCESQPTG